LGRAVRGATERARASRQNGWHLAAAVSAHGWRATINPPYVKASRTTRRASEPGPRPGESLHKARFIGEAAAGLVGARQKGAAEAEFRFDFVPRLCYNNSSS